MNNNNYNIYLEKTENVPGYLSSGLIYNLAIRILKIIQSNKEATKIIEEQQPRSEAISVNELKRIIFAHQSKVNNIITTINEAELASVKNVKKRSLTFRNNTKIDTVRYFYYDLLPIHYVFLNFLQTQGYINNLLRSEIKSIYFTLNQMVQNPKLMEEQNEILDSLIEIEIGEPLEKRLNREAVKQGRELTQKEKTLIFKAKFSANANKYVDQEAVLEKPFQIFEIIKTLFGKRTYSTVTPRLRELRNRYKESIQVNNGLAQIWKTLVEKDNRGELTANEDYNKVFNIKQEIIRNQAAKKGNDVKVKDLIEIVNGKQIIKKDVVKIINDLIKKIYKDFATDKSLAITLEYLDKKKIITLNRKKITDPETKQNKILISIDLEKDGVIYKNENGVNPDGTVIDSTSEKVINIDDDKVIVPSFIEKINNFNKSLSDFENIERPTKEVLNKYKQIIDFFSILFETYLEENKFEIDLQSAEDFEDPEENLFPLPEKTKIRRFTHQTEEANFELPTFAKDFNTKHKGMTKQVYLQSYKDLEELFSELSKEFGQEILGAKDQRKRFGQTSVFNDIMYRLEDESDENVGFPIISEYGYPYDPKINSLKFSYSDLEIQAKYFKNKTITRKQLFKYLEDKKEDMINEILEKYIFNPKVSVRSIKESDLETIFKTIYKSESDSDILHGVSKLLSLMKVVIIDYRIPSEKNPLSYFKINPDTNLPRRPFISKLYKNVLQWYDVENPMFNEEDFDPEKTKNFTYFSQGEQNLIMAILETRGIGDGGASASDVDEVYLDYVTFIRALVNGDLTLNGRAVTNLSKISYDEIRNKLIKYRQKVKEMNKLYHQSRRKKGMEIGAFKRRKKLTKQKEYGEKSYSQADIRRFKKELKLSEKELSIQKSMEVDNLLNDYFRSEYLKELKEKKVTERDDFFKGIEEYNRIIKINSSTNNISPNIVKKPKTNEEIKKFLADYFKNYFTSPKDIELAKFFFNEIDGDYFNFKFFRADFIEARRKKMELAESRPKVDPTSNLIDIPELSDDSIKNFLKKYFPKLDNVAIAKEVFTYFDPPEKYNEGKIDIDFFEATYKYLSDLKGSEKKLEEIEKIKKATKDKLVNPIITPRSTNRYSNVLYLELKDLSKEMVFSETSTGITMNLYPDKSNQNIGTYRVYVSRHKLNEFIKLNPYILSSTVEDQLKDVKLDLTESAQINSDEDILVFTGTYETIFKPYIGKDGKLTIDQLKEFFTVSDNARKLLGDSAEAAMIADIVNAPDPEEVFAAIEKNRLTSTKIENMIRKLERISSGKAPLQKTPEVEDAFSISAIELLEIFEEHIKIIDDTFDIKGKKAKKADKSVLIYKANVIDNISEFKSLIKKYQWKINSVLSDKKIEELKEKVILQANKTLKHFFIFYDKYITKFFDNLKNIIKEKNRFYLSTKTVVLGSKSGPKIVFNQDQNSSLQYTGKLSNSYIDQIKIINDFMSYYLNFNVTHKERLLEDIKDIQEKFIFVQDTMDEFLKLVESDSSTQKIIDMDPDNLFSSDPLLKDQADFSSYQQPIVKSKSVFIENYETGYKKVEIVKPNKFTILHAIKSKYEIK